MSDLHWFVALVGLLDRSNPIHHWCCWDRSEIVTLTITDPHPFRSGCHLKITARDATGDQKQAGSVRMGGSDSSPSRRPPVSRSVPTSHWHNLRIVGKSYSITSTSVTVVFLRESGRTGAYV